MKSEREQLAAELAETLALAERAARLARKTGSTDWHQVAVEACRNVARLADRLA